MTVEKIDGPWYTRSELWATFISVLTGWLTAANVDAPVVQAIGATVAGIAPLVYTWGRTTIKAKAIAVLGETPIAEVKEPPIAE